MVRGEPTKLLRLNCSRGLSSECRSAQRLSDSFQANRAAFGLVHSPKNVMQVLISGNDEQLRTAIQEVLVACASGVNVIGVCSLRQLAENVIQHRPDVAIVTLTEDVEEALQGIQESHEAYPSKVIAVGPSSDARLILRTLDQGVDKYVDSASLDPELPAALRKIGSQPKIETTRGRVISFLGCSGGCGASTILVNVAAALSKKNKKTHLLDLDLTSGDVTSMMGLSGTHSISEFCSNLSKMDPTLLQKCLVTANDYLSVMPSPSSYKKIDMVTSRGVRKAINMLRASGSYLLIDVENSYRPEQAQALFASDVIVLVFRGEFTSVRQASRVLAYFSDLGIPEQRIRLVVNRYVSRQSLRRGDIESSLQMQTHFIIPENSKHMCAAINRGIPLVIDRPRSPVSQYLSELASSVNGAVDISKNSEKTN